VCGGGDAVNTRPCGSRQAGRTRRGRYRNLALERLESRLLLSAPTIERVSVADDGTEGDNHSSGASISADGRYVAFESDASNLVPGDANSRQDIFVYDRGLEIGTISGTKYEDMDGNGMRDPGVRGLADWTIFLDEDDDATLDWTDGDGDGQWDAGEGEQWTTTLSNGTYMFTALTPALYHPAEVQQAGWVQTSPPAGSHDVTLASGDAVTGVDFGNYQQCHVAGWTFHDLDGNGVKDPGEPVLAGCTVYLDTDDDGVLDAGELYCATGAGGSYWIGNLAPGTHILRQVLTGPWAPTVPVSPDKHVVVLTSGQVMTHVDFGRELTYRLIEQMPGPDGGTVSIYDVDATEDIVPGGATVGGSAIGARFSILDVFKGLTLSGDFTDSDVWADRLAKVTVKGVISQTGGSHGIRADTGSHKIQDATWKGVIDAANDHYFTGGLHAWADA